MFYPAVHQSGVHLFGVAPAQFDKNLIFWVEPPQQKVAWLIFCVHAAIVCPTLAVEGTLYPGFAPLLSRMRLRLGGGARGALLAWYYIPSLSVPYLLGLQVFLSLAKMFDTLSNYI
jgi:hypothetical protein